MVYDSRLTVSGSRPDTKLCQERNSVPGTKSNSGTAESQWWRRLQRSCASCATCATFFEFLLKNISKHILTSVRTFDLKTWHSWHRPVELLYTLTISCGTPGTNLARTWHRSSLSGTEHQNGALLSLITRIVSHKPRSPKHRSTNMFHGA